MYDLRVIVDMMEHVLKKIAEKYSNVREGVGAVMGGRVLRVQGEEFYNAGVERGLEQGLERGLEQGLERGLEQGRREERQSIMARLIAGGISTQEAARSVGLTV